MCVELPKLPDPTLGLGLSLQPPALPEFSGSLDLCCKNLPYAIVPPAIPFPPGIFNGAVAVGVSAVIAAVNTYLDSLIPDCPLE